MLIAVVSDTHGAKNAIRRVKKAIANADVLIHLGDNIADLKYIKEDFKGEVYGVNGNCDFTSNFPIEQIVEIEGKRFFITHGHKYGVKYDISTIFYKGKELGVDAVLFGHTHVKVIDQEEGVWIINPGSTSLPKDRSESMAFIEIKNNSIYAYTKDL